MLYFEKTIRAVAEKINWVAAFALIAMMLLTSLDVLLRLFRHPLPGTYEIIGLLGAVVISFSLGYTSVEKGHIAVDILTRNFSSKTRALIEACNALVGTVLFAVVAWQGLSYSASLMQKGEVSLTVQMPIYPFAYGVTGGCGLLCIVLFADFLRELRTYKDMSRE